MTVIDPKFKETLAALNNATERLSMECTRRGEDPNLSLWMEIQVIGNVVTSMYRDLYAERENG